MPGRRMAAAFLLMLGGMVALTLIPLVMFPLGCLAIYLICPGFVGLVAAGMVMLFLAIRAQRRSQR